MKKRTQERKGWLLDGEKAEGWMLDAVYIHVSTWERTHKSTRGPPLTRYHRTLPRCSNVIEDANCSRAERQTAK